MTSHPKKVCQIATAILFAVTAGAISSARAAESPVGMVAEPCPAPLPMPEGLRDRLGALFLEPRKLTPADMQDFVRDPRLAEWERENRQRAALDWPGLCRYRADNQRLLRSAITPRVVFIGDSITENWALADPGFFDNGLVGRGIGGQTTPQMLVRFRADVVALRPRIVHLMAGTNDIAGNTGPTTTQDYKNNIMTMVEIAQANGIAVILGSIPPAAEFSWRPGLNPLPRIKELNDWLRSYAATQRIEFVDYHSVLAGPAGELQADLGNDGVHPNRRGYALMRQLIEPRVSTRNR